MSAQVGLDYTGGRKRSVCRSAVLPLGPNECRLWLWPSSQTLR